LPEPVAHQPRTASSLNQTVTSPRWRSASFYSAQFVTRYFAFENLSRRDPVNLKGIPASRNQIIRPATLQMSFVQQGPSEPREDRASKNPNQHDPDFIV